jgi:hypothetical protein
VNAERDVVEARKAQGLKDLVEVERRRQAGEIDAETAEHLKKIYEAEVVAALEPEPVSVASPRHLSLGRWDRMTGAMTLAGIVVVACVAIVAVVVGHSTVRERLGAVHGVDGRRRWARPLDGHRRRDGSGDQAEPVDHPDAARPDRALLEGGQPREGEGARSLRSTTTPPSQIGQGAEVPRLDHCRARRPPNGRTCSTRASPSTLRPRRKWFLANVELTQLEGAQGATALLQEILDQPISDAQRTSVEAKLKEAEGTP